MSKKILIVDDEKPLAKALELKLNHEGLQAEAVFNGDEAIKALKSGSFNLVLLDLVMPDTDGFSVLEEIKKMKIKTSVIVSSNLSQEEDQEKAKELGAIDYFVKSDTTLADIVDRIKQHLT